MARDAGTLVKTLAMNKKTPHLGPTNPPQTSKDRQRSANVMFPHQSWLEDLNLSGLPVLILRDMRPL